MDPRIEFFQSLIHDRSKRILELGPLNRPIADKSTYPNTFYCDIRSTEEVKTLYSGNDYLAATGIMVNTEEIVPIDYVVKNGYSKSLSHVEKFDYVIASHVMEHVDDLIFALQDIAKLLKPGGIFYIVYPDKRYCFDHFRTSASFRDAYHVFRQGVKNNAPMVLDFYFSVVPENDASLFWGKDGLLNELPRAPFANAVAHYERALDGERMEDVHYWPFTDMDFLKFLYDCTRAGLLPFHCVSFQPCVQDDQQFMIALQLDPSTLENPERALKDLRQWMGKTLPDFYSAKDIEAKESLSRLQNVELPGLKIELEKQVNLNGMQSDRIIELKNAIEQAKAHGQEQTVQIRQLEDEVQANRTRISEMMTINQDQVTRIQQLEDELQAKGTHISEMMTINQDQVTRIQQLDAETQAYKTRITELSTIENSRIWHMTAPLRNILDFLKGVFGKNEHF